MCFLLPYSSCSGAHVFNEQFGINSSKLYSVCVHYSTPPPTHTVTPPPQSQRCVYEVVTHMMCLTRSQESVCPTATTEDFPALCSGCTFMSASLCRVDQGHAWCCMSFPSKYTIVHGPCLKFHFIPFYYNSTSRTSSQLPVPWRHNQTTQGQQILHHVNNDHWKQKPLRNMEIVPRRKHVLSCSYFVSSG